MNNQQESIYIKNSYYKIINSIYDFSLDNSSHYSIEDFFSLIGPIGTHIYCNLSSITISKYNDVYECEFKHHYSPSYNFLFHPDSTITINIPTKDNLTLESNELFPIELNIGKMHNFTSPYKSKHTYLKFMYDLINQKVIERSVGNINSIYNTIPLTNADRVYLHDFEYKKITSKYLDSYYYKLSTQNHIREIFKDRLSSARIISGDLCNKHIPMWINQPSISGRDTLRVIVGNHAFNKLNKLKEIFIGVCHNQDMDDSQRIISLSCIKGKISRLKTPELFKEDVSKVLKMYNYYTSNYYVSWFYIPVETYLVIPKMKDYYYELYRTITL